MTALRRPMILVLLAAVGISLTACANTIRGAGRDIQQSGEAIEDTAEGNP